MHLPLLLVMLCGFLLMTKDLRKINLTGIMACSGSVLDMKSWSLDSLAMDLW